jgi:hypothetical protein
MNTLESKNKLNILVLGDKGYGQRSHFSENIALEFAKEHEIFFISVEDIKEQITEKRYELHRYRKMPFKMSRFEPKKNEIDFIFQDQCDFEYVNDVNVPVFYNQKYVHRRFGCYYPNVALFLTQGLMDYCMRDSYPWEVHLSMQKFVMPCCTELDTYHPEEKIYEGINWFGSRNDSEEAIDHLDLMGIAQRTLYRWEERIIRKLARNKKNRIHMHETPCPTLKYRELLRQSEAMWMSIPRGQFISRMVFEAMACKTLTIFEIQSPRHEETLRSLGFRNGGHYIGLNKLEDITKVYEMYSERQLEAIVENAYKAVTENHTYKNRADYIITIYNNLFGKYRQVKTEQEVKVE